MRFLIVGLNNGSQITRFREEAVKLGHEVIGCKSSDLVIESGDGKFIPKIGNTPLTSFDLIYLCAGVESKKRYEWFIATDYLIKNTKTKVVNSVVAETSLKYYPVQSWFYLKQFETGLPFPKTYTVYNSVNLDKIEADLGYPMIVKISETHQGKGVFLCSDRNQVEKVIEDNSGQVFILRKFIPNDFDIRVITVGGKAIGAMKRIPKSGDFKSNISQGGVGENLDLEKYPDIKEIAEKSVKITNIEIAGVDIITDKTNGTHYLIEINIGPQFKGFEKYTGINAATAFVNYFESLCK